MTKPTLLGLCAAALISATAHAAIPANAPPGTTGLCKDGTFYSGATKQGACKGHKGVKEWYADEAKPDAKTDAKAGHDAKSAAATAPASTAKPATAPATAAAPAAAPPAAPPAAQAQAAAKQTPTQVAQAQAAKPAAPGGGAGKVWVNKGSKVYHCPGDKWYGKTKEGEYMTEADATAQGFKADHGKACK
jgi:hypothetical protein